MSILAHPPGAVAWIGVAVALMVTPCRASAQQAEATAHVRRAENFRQTPNGTVLGQLDAGTPLAVVSRRGSWLEVDVEGWSWTRSYQRTERDGYDVVLTAEGGENLRAKPSGGVVGHLERGTLLHEVERQPGWLHVRRRGWIWSASVTEPSAPSAPPGAGAPGVGRSAQNATVDAAGGTSSGSRDVVRVGATGTAVLDSAGGDTIAKARPGSQVQVLSRRGAWAHVRLEGWSWIPASDSAVASLAVDTSLTPSAVRDDPADSRGRMVAWELQFISLERAEKVRTDFSEGEPYLLTRYGDSEGQFVYVAVPPDRLGEVRGLVPLERISVTGRVRTGASSLTGSPIIEMSTLSHARHRH